MELTMNQIIEYYANTTIQFVNVFSSNLAAGKKDSGRKTARGVCGIVIPLKGHAHFSFNQTVYKMNEHTIVHAGSAMDIEVETLSEAWEYAVIHYQIVDAPPAFKEMEHQHFLMMIDDHSKIQQQVRHLLQQQTKPDYMSKFHMQVTFLNLLESILLSARNEGYENKMDMITAALEYIHQHYYEELFVSEIAERFGIERRRFSYLFERLTGLTPIQYLTEYRIRLAKELLKTSTYSIAKVAEEVGYVDSFYFSRVFKKHVKMSPSSYRKRNEKSPFFTE